MGRCLRVIGASVLAALCAIPLGSAFAGSLAAPEVDGPALPADRCPAIVAAFEDAAIAAPTAFGGAACPSLADASAAIDAFQRMAKERVAFEAGLPAGELDR